MKTFLLNFVLILISSVAISQAIVNLSPPTTYKNNTTTFSITGHNTHFKTVDSNFVTFTNGTDVVSKWIKQLSDESFLYCFDMGPFQNTGFYDLRIINSIDDTLKYEDAVFISNSHMYLTGTSQYTLNINENYNINVTADLTHFDTASNLLAYFVNNTNDTISVDSIGIIGHSNINLFLNTNINDFGIYNLFIYNSIDGLLYYQNAINIINNNYTQIDKVSPDTLINYGTLPIITLYGHNTHFTQDSPTILLTGINNFSIHDINIINDSVLTIKVAIPIACKDMDYMLLRGFVYNNVDGFLGFSFNAVLIGSINKSNINNIIELFPNPVDDGRININFHDIPSKQSTLSIYNSLGQMVLSTKLQKGISNQIISVSELKSGVYFYSLTIDNTKLDEGKFIIK